MTSGNSGGSTKLELPDEKEFLYTVLNLPKTASDYDIRERYKQLSIVFHPDKQHNENSKVTALQRFLEIQKAYEVLSDPISRQAYDMYGADGLKLLPNVPHTLSMEEVRVYPPIALALFDILQLKENLKRGKLQADHLRLSEKVRSSGFASFSIDASCFTEPREDLVSASWKESILERWRQMPQWKGTARQNIRREITSNTTLNLSVRAATGNRSATGGGFVGTLRHQFSPRLAFETEVSCWPKRPMIVKTTYSDGINMLAVKSHVSPAWFLTAFNSLQKSSGLTLRSLPIGGTYSRRLFPRSNAQASFAISTPSSFGLRVLSFTVSSAHQFDFAPENDVQVKASMNPQIIPPSRSGLARGEYYYSVGAALNGVFIGLTAECGVSFTELGLHLKTMLLAGLEGVNEAFVFGWAKDGKGVDAEISLGSQGVQLKLGFVHLNYHMEVPITLSHEHDPKVAFWTVLLPMTTVALAYHFVLRPLEHKRRMEFFRQAKRELRDASSELVRQTDETISLLRDVARRHMQAEAAVDGSSITPSRVVSGFFDITHDGVLGLVILEATYGAAERDELTEGLEMDVTIPLQALVHRSQLYIPGRRSKVGLQGFRDPVPNVAKSLRVRYTFHGREHYAEIPDYKPTVLPLEAFASTSTSLAA
ncbi:DnaJ-domain-containing protein [Cristinia sonorae]|uniref:DnaJ-domain-containing protein n=1 Tax=Cristinia sonorae TaxID=1940300 RepID=A0A8K0URI0_9AGAR|nr:DnaJ-domain-containing protein [Cristinia sonorae]